MKRRDFIKKGTLTFALAAGGGISFSFIPDVSQEEDEFDHRIPFRKPARNIKEHIPGFLWADAADFQDYGGWALDTQHVGFMGSSYLLAHGTSQTVKDASLKINKVRSGKYRLWVRSRNWMQEHAPGQFGIKVNGKDSGAVFGAQKEKGWSWQDGGLHEISGEAILKLQDKTGQFGRCSSVILTRELDYKPPVEVETFKQERARLSGVSDAIVSLGDYDIVVVGAGVSGCCAAVAAAREGANVALISDRPVLGGNASKEIGVPVQGAANHQGLARETGIIEEAGRLGKASDWGRVMSKPFESLVGEEENVTLIQNVWLENVNMMGDQIRSAVLRETLTGERLKVSGNMFIDCSGDSWLGYHAGADSRLGREARSEHNETNAPEKADSLTMSGCLRGPRSNNYQECIFYQTMKENSSQAYTAPSWIYQLPENGWFTNGEGHYKRKTQHNQEEAINGTWWLEHPGDVDDLNDPEYARDQLIRVCHTLWDFWKNKWEEKDKIAPYRLAYIPFTVGKRETRRLMGDYILNQNDCEAGRHFPDAIGHYGWPLDLHAPMGIMDNNGRYYSDTRIPMGHIPYRCLYSRNVENMLMAGRNVSVTHVALGTVRVEGQCALMGQAAGTAAALAVRHKTTPRGIYKKHMGELQQVLLKNDQTIPKVANQDAKDLARTAAISASSHHGEDWKPANIVNGLAHPVKDKETNMWESSPKETLPQWIELKLNKPAKVGTIQCTFDTDLDLSLASQKEVLPSVCVRDYTIEGYVDGKWKNLLNERGNFQRFRRHQFAQVKTDRIRLTVEATHGAKTARVLEIRAYKDAKA